MGSLEREFGWSRASLSTGMALCALLSALSLPFVGLLMDKIGVRRVLMVAICLFALNVAAISFTNSLALFVALTALTGVTGAAQSPMGYVKSIAGYFDRRRGLAIGIAMSGVGIGTALVPQYVQWVIAEHGWRAGYVGLGLAILVVALPAVALLVREPRAATNPSMAATVPGLELREAMTRRSFWCIAATVLLVSIAVNGALVHVVPLLVDSGWAPAAATRVLAVAGVAGLAGRLLAGYLMDRVFGPFVASGFFALAILGLYSLGSGINAYVGMILIGLAAGAEVDMIGFFVSRYYGLRRFGQIYGVLFAVFTIGAGLGPLLMGASHTNFGSYYFGLLGCGAALAAAALCVLAVGPYRFGALVPTGSSATAKTTGALLGKRHEGIRSMTTKTFEISVNSRRESVQCDGTTPLLYVLRNDLGQNGPKFGCGLGQCGACTVLLNGQPTRSCVLPVSAVRNGAITTLDGLAKGGKLHPLQQAFIDAQAAQCGFCTNGMIMSAKALLDRSKKPTEDDIKQALNGHLCRCGSHNRIVTAVRRAAESGRV